MKRAPRQYRIVELGAVPDWWGAVYWTRQLEIRRRIRVMLTAARGYAPHQRRGGPRTGLSLFFALSGYERREVDAALERMLVEGTLGMRGEEYYLIDFSDN